MDGNEVNVNRVYWSVGGGIVAWGVWFFASPFWGKQEALAPVRRAEVREPAAERASSAPRNEVKAAVRVPEPVRQEVNAVYASVAPKRDAPEAADQDELSAAEQSTLVRKPVIDAIRLLGVSKADKYDRMLEALRHSGDSAEAWTLRAPDVFAGWSRSLDGKANAELNERSVRCYLAGCEIQVHFANEAEYEAAARVFRSLSEEGPTHGGRVQTPPKQLEDGRWVAAWLMLRPDVGVE